MDRRHEPGMVSSDLPQTGQIRPDRLNWRWREATRSVPAKSFRRSSHGLVRSVASTLSSDLARCQRADDRTKYIERLGQAAPAAVATLVCLAAWHLEFTASTTFEGFDRYLGHHKSINILLSVSLEEFADSQRRTLYGLSVEQTALTVSLSSSEPWSGSLTT